MSAQPDRTVSPLRRWTKRLLFGVYLVVTVGVLAEIGLRIVVGTKPAYYTGFGNPEPNSVIHYPYGEIRFNSDAFPDDEFGEKLNPRVAYIGDSVCYGVGAGHGFRISELLEERLPQTEHLNFGLVAYSGIHGHSENELFRRVIDPFEIDQVVYLLNLNDILPERQEGGTPTLRAGKWRRRLDWLRGKSYVYTQIRTVVKSYYVRKGYGVHGAISFELFPTENADIIRNTARRVNEFGRKLSEHGIRFVIVLLPYEMQISDEAADTYRKLGIRWEAETFLDRGPQKLLIENLDEDIPLIDAYHAFMEAGRSRSTNRVGQFFVYNQGDRLDWNHPNREGHRVIADYMAESGLIGP